MLKISMMISESLKTMYEFWLKEKLLLTIGLFQFGLILIMFIITNFSKLIWHKLVLDKRNISEQDNLNKIKSTEIFSSSALDKQVANQVKDAMNNPVNHEKNLTQTMPDLNIEPLINYPETNPAIVTLAIEPESIEVDLEVDLTYKVDIAPDLLTELKEISNDPAAMIDEAIRWWLRRRTFDILDSSSDRQDRVGLKSNSSKRLSQSLWND